MFYFLISGKRDFTDYEKFCECMDEVVQCVDEPITIIEGGAKGTDALAKRYAEDHGHTLKEFPADWEKHGRAAGPIRNSEMVDFVKGMEHRAAIFFWDGKSRGTGDCMRKAEKAEIVYEIYRV